MASPAQTPPETLPTYLRFAAVGDSTTVGVGDPLPGHPIGLGAGATGRDGTWRGWATLLAESLDAAYDVSFCNLAVSGATARDVAERQLRDAVDHRPDLASLVVGLNDTMRSTWDPALLREDLLEAARRLTGRGALLMTVRFHDHGAVFGLPRLLRAPLQRRIDGLNAIYDEVYARFGGVRVDLAECPEVLDRSSWSVDRLHPSERGHRALARGFARELAALGVQVAEPSAEPDNEQARTWRAEVTWMVAEGAPWVGRRARDLGPWAARAAWRAAVTPRLTGARSPQTDQPAAPDRPAPPRTSAAGGHDDRFAMGDGDGVLAVGTP